VTAQAIKSLTLLRHAKSSWNNAHMGDHERPLNDRGRRDAPEMADRLLKRSCLPDRVYTSSASRALETTALVTEVLGIEDTHVQVFDRLYLASAENILSVIAGAETAGIQHLMVIGHNPGLETLGCYLSPQAMESLPTAGLYHFSCTGFDLTRSHEGDDRRRPSGVEDSDTYTRANQQVNLVFQDYPKNL